ncbi:MAG: ABC transporter substrate-binding protein [Chloroflexi bacterium]|nr:ABC transporter substrate-binding protein [Chloroflexota bacterium]
MRKIACFVAVISVVMVVTLAACSPRAPSSSSAPAPATSTTKPSSSVSASPSATAKPSSSPTATTSPVASRQAELEAAAKKEGKVTLWAPHAKNANTYLAKFKARYPWLTLEAWDANGETIVEKLVTEAKAGKHNVDVISMDEATIQDLTPYFVKYDWPNVKLADWPKDTMPASGLYIRSSMSVFGPVYNTKTVTGADVPNSWDAIKDPKWKGKAGAPVSAQDIPMLTAALWGSDGKLDWDKSFAYWREVFKNTQARTVQTYTTGTQLLGAGEYSLLIASAGSTTFRENMGGLPVSLAPVGQIIGMGQNWALVKDAPHPNAAKLLADFVTTTEGATDFANIAYHVSLNPTATGAKPNVMMQEQKIKVFVVPPALLNAENGKKSSQFWNSMLGY